MVPRSPGLEPTEGVLALGAVHCDVTERLDPASAGPFHSHTVMAPPRAPPTSQRRAPPPQKAALNRPGARSTVPCRGHSMVWLRSREG